MFFFQIPNICKSKSTIHVGDNQIQGVINHHTGVETPYYFPVVLVGDGQANSRGVYTKPVIITILLPMTDPWDWYIYLDPPFGCKISGLPGLFLVVFGGSNFRPLEVWLKFTVFM